MSKETDEQLKTTNTHNASNDRVADAGDETESKAAKKASNAALKKDAEKHSTHELSSKTANDTAKGGLEMLAAQFQEASVVFAPLGKGDVTSDVAFNAHSKIMNDTLATLLDDAERVRQLIVSTQDSKRKGLEGAVGHAFGLLNRMRIPVKAATIKQQAYRPDFAFSLSKLDDKFADYKKLLEVQDKVHPESPIKIAVTDDAPAGTEDMMKPAIDKLVEALGNDVASVKAGNWMDVNRVVTHSLALKDLGESHMNLMRDKDVKKKIDSLVNNLEVLHKAPQSQSEISSALTTLRHFQ